MRLIKKRKCKHCHEMFLPDYRNVKHQAYCGKPSCRKASKTASQKRWSEKPDNQDYFKGPVHVQRVTDWRKLQSKSTSKKKAKSGKVLQDHCRENLVQIQTVRQDKNSMNLLLQDLCAQQPYVIIGLIAQLTGAVLQDDIEITVNRMRELGRDIFINPNRKGDPNDSKTTHLPGTCPKSSTEIQLDRSPPGSGATY